ncbi:MAG TPA: GvpL/GvpF family gas vesicle protein [Solirubrobacterales bacterium]|nr:GvpL/GvpF family gas vesicle protein [Solirubrobacterales bacterium]
MSLCVYAITDTLDGPLGAGPHGAPLRRVGAGRLAAVVSERPRALEPDEDLLWAHERVVEELMESATILPLRFGSSVERAESLTALLEERREEFLTALERVRGAVEVGVRAELPQPEPEGAARPRGSPGPGTAYLLERAREERRGREAAELVHRPLAALARRSAPALGPSDPRRFKVAYLVDQGALDAFASRVTELNAGLAGAKISCTGPWPPYSFVGEGSS